MTRTAIALIALLFQFPQQQQQQQQTRPQDRGSIAGYVIKMGTSDPLGKAVVTISAFNGGRSQSYTATTTSAGQFMFQNLEPGQYRLSAARSGYIRMEYGARTPNRPGLPLNLNPGQKLTDVVLPIMSAGTISGRVFDRDGEPLANVNVQALKYSYQEGQKVLNSVQQARTNDLGEYRLFWLQPGQYFVSATPPAGQRGALMNALAVAGPGIAGALGDLIAAAAGNGGGRGNAGNGGNRGGRGGGGGGGGGAGPRGAPPDQPPAPPVNAGTGQDQADEGYIPVYYPGTTDAQAAAPISLPPGVVFSGVDLSVAPVRTLTIHGQVINGLTGQPAARNANILLVPSQSRRRGGIRNGGDFRSRILNDQGAFEIRGVVPGSYSLIGLINDRNNRMTASVPIEVGNSDIQNVSLIISPGFTVAGHLTIEGQQAGAGNQDLQRVRVMLRPEDMASQIAGAPPAAQVQADGTFNLQQVGRDEYRLTVSGMPRTAYVKSARLGGIDILSDGLRLDRTPSAPIDIIVGTTTGIADGIARNEKQEPSANVTVVLVPDAAHRNRLDLYRTTSTDAMGHFHVEGVPPGDYSVFSWEDVESGAWQDPDFIRKYEDRGKPVRINESGSTTSNIELRVIPPQV